MQNTAHNTTDTLAPVISLAERRASRARASRRRLSPRPLVALWFGSAIFATAALLGFAIMTALREPLIGIPAGIALASAASWQAAGAWLRSRQRPQAA